MRAFGPFARCVAAEEEKHKNPTKQRRNVKDERNPWFEVLRGANNDPLPDRKKRNEEKEGMLQLILNTENNHME